MSTMRAVGPMPGNRGACSNGVVAEPNEKLSESFFQKLLRFGQTILHPRGNPTTVDILLCDLHLRLAFSSQRLSELLTRAFQHCPTPPEGSEPDFTLHIFSGEAEKFLAELPWEKSDFELPRGEISSSLGPDILAACYLQEIVYICHRPTNQALCWFRKKDRPPRFEQAAPFRPILHWWLRENGWIMVHGAGLGNNDGLSLLLMGKSGTGKSTLSVAAAFSGEFQFLGDDYCAVKTDPPHHLATIYSTAKVSRESCRLLQLKPPDTVLEITRKHLFFMAEELADRIPPTLPLAGLVLPEIDFSQQCGPDFSAISPLTPAQAAIQLSVSSLYQLPHAGGNEFKRLSSVARTLPGWTLKLPNRSPEAIIPGLKKLFHEISQQKLTD